MLSASVFVEQINKLNNVLSEKAQIHGEAKFDIYFETLSEFSDQDFIRGISKLASNIDTVYFCPSPKTIYDAVFSEKYNGLSCEDVDTLLRVFRQMNFGDPNKKLEEIVENSRHS